MQKDICDCRVIHLEQIDKARESSYNHELVDELCQLFKAMGDPTRLKILRALELNEMCVCDLAAFLGISESGVSHQLRLLRTLRLVNKRRDGTVLYYRLTDHHVSQLMEVAFEHVQE